MNEQNHKHITLIVEQEERLGDHQSHIDTQSDNHECLYNIHLVDAGIYHQISERFDQLVAPDEKSGDHESHQDLSSREHACLYQIICKSVLKLLKHFTVEQCGVLTD